MAYNGGKLENLIDPQVLAEFLTVKMMDAIKLSPLCNVRNDLVGVAGDTLSIPKYAFIGLAEDVAEGADVPMGILEATKEDFKVKKAGKGVKISDEAILSAYGDPVNEIGRQLLMAVAGKIENDCFVQLRTATLTHSVTGALDKNAVADALVKFGEDIFEKMYLFISPAKYAELRKNNDFVAIAQGQAIIDGHVGTFMGCEVVVSNRVGAQEAFIIKENALDIIMKRDVVVEADRDIVNKTNVYVADEHYVVALVREDRAIKLTFA